MAHGPSDLSQMTNQFGSYVTTRQLAADRYMVVYRARKSTQPPHDTSEQYVVVLFRSSPEESLPETAISPQDLQQQFIEAVKLQKQARENGLPHIAPIHEFGVVSQGAWYASDYYARGFLKKWISQRAGVTEEELRHLISSIIEGLASLKRSFGRTHGKLAPSAILIGGKIGTPLREAPVDLTFIEPSNKQKAGSFEINDLKALGQIIYQLVCRQDIELFNPDLFPVPASEYWMELGKNGEYWRGLCNRLLDPQLSIEKLNIESLATEFKPKRTMAGLAIFVIYVILGVIGTFVYYKQHTSKTTPLQTSSSSPLPEKPASSQTQTAKLPTSTPLISVSEQTNRSAAATNLAPNTPPEIIAISNQVIELGQSFGPIEFTIHDQETAASNLAVNIKSLSPAIIESSQLSLGGSGSNRSIALTTELTQTGTCPLVLWVSDGTLSATNVFLIKIKSAYQPPFLKGLKDESVPLGTASARYPFQIADNDSIAEGLFVAVASSNPSFMPPSSVKIEGTGAHRMLVIDPVPQQTGQAICAISVSDIRTNVTESFWFRVTQ